MLLVCHAHPTMLRYRHPSLGRLVQPRHTSSVERTAAEGIPWAADNDAFKSFDEPRFVKMLDRIAHLPGCLFVAAPDVVADANATGELYASWGPAIRSRGLPAALVAQDGLSPSQVPWDGLDALFVGGSTEWKLGFATEQLVRQAKRLGKHVHMGRVNSRKRVSYAASIGCDSVDGTSFSMFVDRWVPLGIEWAEAGAPPQLSIGSELW